MLPRPPTKIHLTTEDIVAYEQRKTARDGASNEQMNTSISQDTSNSTVEDQQNFEDSMDQGEGMGQESSMVEPEVTPAQQTRAARAAAAEQQRRRIERERRLGVGGSRG